MNATLSNTELLANTDGLFSWDPLTPPTDWITTASFTIEIEVILKIDDYFLDFLDNLENTAPYFVARPENQTLHIGKDFSYRLGEALDYEGDAVTVLVDLGAAESFASFDF